MNPTLIRFLASIGLIGMGFGIYRLINFILLSRVRLKQLGLETFKPGNPGILYFTTPHCVPCITEQRPALAELKALLEDGIQIIQVDALEQPEVAKNWGVLSVPTTFLIDSQGQPRRVNHGVTRAKNLLAQLEEIEGQRLAMNRPAHVEQKEEFPSLGSD